MSEREDMTAVAPIVSVVIVNFNYGRYLGCCLDSIADQTYTNIQCIVVDNASTDDSLDVIEAFKERIPSRKSGWTFETIISSENLRQTKACIAGFRKVKGPYVVFVDADDYLLPNCIEVHIRAHLALRVPVGFTSVDMYQSQETNLVNSTGPEFAKYVMSKAGRRSEFARILTSDMFKFSRVPDSVHLNDSDLHFVDRQMSSAWAWSATSGLCFRTDAVSLMFSYEPKTSSNTDTYLARGVGSLTGSVIIDQPLFVYRSHGQNIFTENPSLANFRPCRIDSHIKTQNGIVDDILGCYLENAELLSKKLDWSGPYFDAIDIVARNYSGVRPDSWFVSSNSLDFMLKNRLALVRAFGRSGYSLGLLKFLLRPRDFLGSIFAFLSLWILGPKLE